MDLYIVLIIAVAVVALIVVLAIKMGSFTFSGKVGSSSLEVNADKGNKSRPAGKVTIGRDASRTDIRSSEGDVSIGRDASDVRVDNSGARDA